MSYGLSQTLNLEMTKYFFRIFVIGTMKSSMYPKETFLLVSLKRSVYLFDLVCVFLI